MTSGRIAKLYGKYRNLFICSKKNFTQTSQICNPRNQCEIITIFSCIYFLREDVEEDDCEDLEVEPEFDDTELLPDEVDDEETFPLLPLS